MLNLPNELKSYIDQLPDDQLHGLFHYLQGRLRLIRHTKDLYSLAQFQPLDRVVFKHDGNPVFGTIIRINRRSATVQTETQGQWHVSPSFLSKIVETSKRKVSLKQPSKI